MSSGKRPRRGSRTSTPVRPSLELFQADVLDELSLVDVLSSCRPHEVYNLASPSFVPMSWRQPVLTAEFAAVGCTALLEAIRRVDDSIRFYQASSSEIFGEPREVPQNEDTPLAPVTPYGVAKAYAHFITRSYRRRYGLHASSGHPLQPRVSSPAARVRHEEGRPRRSCGEPRSRDRGVAGQPRRTPGLGVRGRLRPGDVAHAPAGGGRRLRHRERREPQRRGARRACAFSYVGLDWREHVRQDEALVRGKAELYDLVGDPSRTRKRSGGRLRSTSRSSCISWSTRTSSG